MVYTIDIVTTNRGKHIMKLLSFCGTEVTSAELIYTAVNAIILINLLIFVKLLIVASNF